MHQLKAKPGKWTDVAYAYYQSLFHTSNVCLRKGDEARRIPLSLSRLFGLLQGAIVLS